jgi:uncharacterized protein (TIGR02302 family)
MNVRSTVAARLAIGERRAQLVLLWEALWRAFWQPLALAGLFCALAFFDVLPRFGAWSHIIALAVLAAGFGVTVFRGLRQLRLPTRGDGRRRIESDNALDHRPLSLIDDRLLGGQGEAGAEHLWRAHLARTLGNLGRLRVRAPHPEIARRDPIAIRFAVVLLLIVATVTGYGDLSRRFVRAVTPEMPLLVIGAPASLELWVTPPEYTGLRPTFIAASEAANKAAGEVGDPDGTGEGSARGSTMASDADGANTAPILLPAGSIISAQIHDKGPAPVLTFGDRQWTLEARDERSWSIEAEVIFDEGQGRIFETEISLVQDGKTLGRWPAVYVSDFAPTIAFADQPETERGTAFAITYAAEDDFGVTDVIARIRRIDRPLLTFELDLPAPRRSNGEPVTNFNDLAAHPWAGLPVDVRLEARDAIGQVGVTGFEAALLPERIFLHPVARAIATQRKILTRDPDLRLNVAAELDRIADYHEVYGDDYVVFLALTTAGRRLTYNPPPMINWMSYRVADPGDYAADPVIDEVLAILWNAALRIEDGGLSVAERELRELREQIEQALEDGASNEEVAALLEDLREALDRFFEAATENIRQALENGDLNIPRSLDPEALALSQNDLQEMIERARQLAEMGANEAAAAMLERMQQMLESLRSGSQLGRQQQGESAAEQVMRELQGIIQDQQSLLDETFRRNQEGRSDRGTDGNQDGPSDEERRADGDAAAQQDELRRRLGEFMRQLGEAAGQLPDEFGQAEGSMRQSTEELAEGRPGAAIGPQEDALEALQEGGQQAAQALAEQAQGQGEGDGDLGMGLEALWGIMPGDVDPFGRPLDGNRGMARDDVKVPTESEIQRARQILEELRNRAGDRSRTTDELDYIHRLLRRF